MVRLRWRGTVEIRELRCASDACPHCRRYSRAPTTRRGEVQGESHGEYARRVSHSADAISDCATPTCCARVRTRYSASRLPTRPGRRRLVFLGTGGRLPWRSRCIATFTVAEHPVSSDPDRRAASRSDRRKYSRSGRRSQDPHTNWRRIAWLFAIYAIYLSIRALPDTMKSLPDVVKTLPDTLKKMFRKEPTSPA